MSLFTSLWSPVKNDKAETNTDKKAKEESKDTIIDDFELEEDVCEEEQTQKERPLYLAEFCSRLAGQDDFSDVTFVVGKGKSQKVVPAHRIILAAASPLFEAMVYPPVFPDKPEEEEEEDPLTVLIPGEDPDIFQLLIDGIYSDKVELNAANIMPLIEIAKKYQIEKMQAFCADFMSNDITAENACEIFQLGPDLLGDSEVALDFICENAEEVFDSKSFLNLSKERLAVLVRNDGLGLDESRLLQAILKWAREELRKQGVKETVEEIKDLLKDITPHIRFPTMEVSELATVADSGLLTDEQLLSLFQYIAMKDEKDRARIPCAFNSKVRGGGFICKESKLLQRQFKRDLLGFFGKEVKKLELKLLFRGSKDGYTATAFHRLCDNKGATLTVVKAEGSKNIFGGYFSGAWTSSGNYSQQPAWIFSLVNSTGKPLKVIADRPANNAYCNSGYGPTWGSGHDLHINSNMKSNNNYTNPSSYKTIAPGYTGTFDKTLFAGAYKFTVDDIEVFSVTSSK